MTAEVFVAIASGDFRTPGTWDGPHDGRDYPQAGDRCEINGAFIVDITTDVTCDQLFTSASGGYFNVPNGGITITCNGATGKAFLSSENDGYGIISSYSGLRCPIPTTETLNIVANITGYYYSSVGEAISLYCDGTFAGTINITGDIDAWRSVGTNRGIVNTVGSGTINHTGDLGEYAGSNYTDKRGRTIVLAGTGSWVTTGNLLATGYQGGIDLDSGADCEITGYVYGAGGYYGILVNNGYTGTLTIGGDLYASGYAAVNCIYDFSLVLAAGTTIHNNLGVMGLYVPAAMWLPNSGSLTWEFQTESPYTARTMYTEDVAGNPPVASDVRDGTGFATSLTGTCSIPATSNVRLDVPVDAGVGTAVLTAPDVWDALTSGLTTSGSIGERLKNAATVETVGDQWAVG